MVEMSRRSSILRHAFLHRVLFLLLLLPASAAHALPEAELSAAVRGVLGAPALRHGISGILIESLRDGRVLCASQPDTALMPASNTKVVTAALALHHLGPDYRFRTLVHTQGEISRGVLQGNLILQGFGDPTLTTAALDDFVKMIRQRGIARVTGDLLVDDSFFSCGRIGRGWAWDCLQDYYAMEVSALSLNSNVVAVDVRPSTEVGRPGLLSWAPPIRYFTVRNETVTGPAGAKPALEFQRTPGRNVITIRGVIPVDAPSTRLDGITVEDPALYCGSVLAELLEQAGITIEGRVARGVLPKEGTTPLCRRQSAPLSAILPPFLKPSDNHIGEQIMQTVIAEHAGRTGTPPLNAEAITAAFLKEIGGDPGSIRIVDGSGLSRLNLITPRAMVRILRYVRKQAYAPVFEAALPSAGVDGTLGRRMRGTPAMRNVRAKTGSLNAVSCLSGYATTAAGEPVVFALMFNNYTCPTSEARAAQDRVCVLLSELE